MARDISLVRWDEFDLERITEMAARKVVVDEGRTLVRSYLKKGALVPVHTHAGEQRIRVLQGSLAVVVAGTRVTLGEGGELSIPAGAPHEIEALDDSVVDDVRHGDVVFGLKADP
jgi:quercetin dioxygenase-like cupin family protein